MSEWKKFKLGEVAEIFDGPHATPKKQANGLIFLGISSLSRGKLNNRQFEYISEDDFNRWTRRVTPRFKDIVFSYETRLGEAAIIPKGFKCCLGRRLGLLRSNEKLVDPYFLLYYYLCPLFQAMIQERTIFGTTVDRIPLIDMPNFPIYLPPLPEQRAIAAVLSSLDDKIDLLHRQNNTLEAMAETLFRKWFTEEADEGWKEVPLSHFADNIRDNVKVEDISNYEYYVGLEHIPRKRIILDSWSDTGSIESNKSIFKKYDILFGKLRSYFHKVVCTPINGVCSTDILVIRPKKVQWLPFCLFWFFNKDVVDHSDLGSGGTRMPRTSWEIVSSYKVPCPPAELVMEFDKLVWPSLSKMFLNIDAICTLEKLRDTLLPQLMSGEMRVDV